VSILYASLPDLRATNDICGYAAGDRLLRRMADVVRASFRPYDLTGRWAGNGVVVGLPGVPRADAIIRAGALAQSLVDVGLSSCVGWATGPDDGTDVETLVLTARRRGGMASPAPATQRDERRILVVEDDDVIVGLLKELLTAEGHHVHVVGDGVEASELLSDDGAPDRFSLVLLDISLPGIDGFGVLRRMSVAGTSQRVPVILLSARSRADEVTLGLELGAVDHVAKPFSLPVLLQKVKRALDVHDPR
jgi:CheY-like chemotaxis protein